MDEISPCTFGGGGGREKYNQRVVVVIYRAEGFSHYSLVDDVVSTEVGSAIFFGGALSLECYLFLYVR